MSFSFPPTRPLLAMVAGLLLLPNVAQAVCRVIEPLADSGEEGVYFDPTTTVVVIQSPDQIVDYLCTLEQRIPAPEADPDSRDLLPPEEPDPSICPDGTPAEEIRDTLTHVIMQPSVYARGGRAGLVMPIHRRSDVNAGPPDITRLVSELQDQVWVEETLEFVEDRSLGFQCSDPHYAQADLPIPSPLALYGCGDDGDYYRPGLEGEGTSVVEYSDGETVEFEEIPVSDDYTVTVLSASTADALFQWMDDNRFEHDVVDDAAFRKYVGADHWFVAIDVHPADLGGEEQALAPLVVTYRGDEFPITHELTFDPDGGIIETDLFVLAPEQMAIEQGESMLMYAAPFELDAFADMQLSGFGLDQGWLTRIHMERRMSDALQLDTRLVVADEGARETVVPLEIERNTRVRIAQACCPSNAMPDRDAPGRTFTETRSYWEHERPDDSTLFYSAPEMNGDYCAGGANYDEESYGSGYGCAVAGATASWSPIFLAIFIGLRRRRRAMNRQAAR